MKVVGIDLAGLERNPTGICIMQNKTVKCTIVHTDEQIVALVRRAAPDLVAIDAPLTRPRGFARRCDRELAPYGALPPGLRGMRALTERGVRMKTLLAEWKVIEVLSTATAKMLGYWSKDVPTMQRALISMGLKGDVCKRSLTKDEIDAISAAITAELHLLGKTREVGGEDGRIVIPAI